ncbi:MAG: hypothetical protein ACTSXP_15325 [Promethearchaeota archaeon]
MKSKVLMKCETKMMHENPSAELVNEINSGDYDLATIGRQGASKTQKTFLVFVWTLS